MRTSLLDLIILILMMNNVRNAQSQIFVFIYKTFKLFLILISYRVKFLLRLFYKHLSKVSIRRGSSRQELRTVIWKNLERMNKSKTKSVESVEKEVDAEMLTKEREELTGYIRRKRRLVLIMVVSMFVVTSMILVMSVIHVEINKGFGGYYQVLNSISSFNNVWLKRNKFALRMTRLVSDFSVLKVSISMLQQTSAVSKKVTIKLFLNQVNHQLNQVMNAVLRVTISAIRFPN